MAIFGVATACLFLVGWHPGDMGATGAAVGGSRWPQEMRRYRYYVFPMPAWEGESLQRQPRQQQGNNTGGELPSGTAGNVANILTGLFVEDVRPIVSGSTAFIPAGGLREGVTGLLQGLAPTLQKILFGSTSSFPLTDYTIATAAPVIPTDPPTSPRPRRRRTTTVAPSSTSANPEEGSEEETERPSTTESTGESSSTAASSATQATPNSGESDEETEAPARTAAPTAAPVTERVAGIVPESAFISSTPVPIQAYVPRGTPTTTGLASTSYATQLKVVLEDTSSIVTANVVSNAEGEEKQYVYLVLLPEQYEQLDQLIAAGPSKVSTMTPTEKVSLTEAELLSAEQEIIDVVPMPSPRVTSPPTTVPSSPSTPTTPRSSRYRTRNRNGTTVSPPPHLQLQFYYRLTSTTTTTTTTTTVRPPSTDLPGVKGFEGDDDELEN